MKKILFVIKSLTTHNRQNALCVERVAAYLQRYDFYIDYLSWELKPPIKTEQNVYTVVAPEEIKGIGNLKRLASKILYTPIGNNELVKIIYKRIVELYQKNKYDAVIAVINPVEGAEALYLAKKKLPEMNTILYEIDPNSNRYKTCKSLKEKVWRIRSIRWEKKIYGTFDHIIHMITHKKHYSTNEFEAFKNKTIYLDIPNFESESNASCKYKVHDPLRLLYCGAFYPQMREPYYMFRLFEEVNKTIPLTLDIYTGNSMRSNLEEEAKKQKFISLHHEVSQKELKGIIESSDVLISIGNKDSDFLPSKTLMYMGTSKPIIHFYFDENDVSLAYFQYYPAILSIMQEHRNDADTTDLIIGFIKKIEKGIVVDQKQLKGSLFRNTPEYSAEKICELI